MRLMGLEMRLMMLIMMPILNMSYKAKDSLCCRLSFLHTFQCTDQAMSFKSVPTGAYIPSLDIYHYRNIFVLCQQLFAPLTSQSLTGISSCFLGTDME